MPDCRRDLQNVAIEETPTCAGFDDGSRRLFDHDWPYFGRRLIGSDKNSRVDQAGELA